MNLSRDAARRVYRVLEYLVQGHGDQPDPTEIAVLDAFLAEHALDKASMSSKERPVTDRLKVSANEDERNYMIDKMIEVVAADGCLDAEEQQRLHRLAEFLGLPEARLREKLMDQLMG